MRPQRKWGDLPADIRRQLCWMFLLSVALIAESVIVIVIEAMHK